jgi:hypothetical protein
MVDGNDPKCAQPALDEQAANHAARRQQKWSGAGLSECVDDLRGLDPHDFFHFV